MNENDAKLHEMKDQVGFHFSFFDCHNDIVNGWI